MYRAIGHGRPVVNGYSGHAPPHYGVLSVFLRRGDPSVLTWFAQGRPLTVVVHREYDGRRNWRALVERAGGRLLEESGVGPIFVVPPQPRRVLPVLGAALPSRPHPSVAGSAAIALETEQVVRGLRIPLETRAAEMDPRVIVETSADGRTWTPVWEDWVGGLALEAALADQQRIPLTIPLPDVRARYIRVTPALPWLERVMTAHPAR